jgi:hypothetical protein
MRSASGGAHVPRRRRETSRGAEHSPEIPTQLPDVRPIRRSPQRILRNENALDEATHYLYGCSFQQFLDAAYRHAYHHGHRVGYKEGRTAGYRAAKGLPEARRKRGRPSVIGETLRPLFVHTVEERKPGESVKDAVRRFLRVMRVSAKEKLRTEEVVRPLKLPTEQEAVRAYYRNRKKPKNSLS